MLNKVIIIGLLFTSTQLFAQLPDYFIKLGYSRIIHLGGNSHSIESGDQVLFGLNFKMANSDVFRGNKAAFYQVFRDGGIQL